MRHPDVSGETATAASSEAHFGANSLRNSGFLRAASGGHAPWNVAAARGSVTGHSPDGSLIDAACRGDVGALRERMAAGADPNARQQDGSTALMYAAVGRHAEAAALLLAAGADVNARAEDGSTALIKAALWGATPIVAMLLAHGADPDAKDNDGWTALRIAEARGHEDIRDMLRHAAVR